MKHATLSPHFPTGTTTSYTAVVVGLGCSRPPSAWCWRHFFLGSYLGLSRICCALSLWLLSFSCLVFALYVAWVLCVCVVVTCTSCSTSLSLSCVVSPWIYSWVIDPSDGIKSFACASARASITRRKKTSGTSKKKKERSLAWMSPYIRVTVLPVRAYGSFLYVRTAPGCTCRLWTVCVCEPF